MFANKGDFAGVVETDGPNNSQLIVATREDAVLAYNVLQTIPAIGPNASAIVEPAIRVHQTGFERQMSVIVEVEQPERVEHLVRAR
ncbi:MAG: hypothetical protein AAF961_00295, partial [Planctomycetota bacterium]